ncbi:MAG: septum site-determining protein MinC [Lachnospiraceae bacterium]|nr:septum site-determining protein MinC [Lachnospiraceae bacterium]
MDKVIVKNQRYGIMLRLDPDAEFGEILQEIGTKFEVSRKFFGNAQLTLSYEGRVLSPQEEDELAQTVSAHSDIQVLCVFVTDEDRNAIFLRARNKFTDETKALIKSARPLLEESKASSYETICGSINEGKILRKKGNVLVLGNVEDGTALMAGGNVVVTGSIFGVVHAGDDTRGRHFVYAAEVAPRKILVDGIRLAALPKKGLFGKRRGEAGAVLVRDGACVFINEKDLRKEDLEGMTSICE